MDSSRFVLLTGISVLSSKSSVDVSASTDKFNLSDFLDWILNVISSSDSGGMFS